MVGVAGGEGWLETRPGNGPLHFDPWSLFQNSAAWPHPTTQGEGWETRSRGLWSGCAPRRKIRQDFKPTALSLTGREDGECKICSVAFGFPFPA